MKLSEWMKITNEYIGTENKLKSPFFIHQAML
jgi:hypothetical protein